MTPAQAKLNKAKVMLVLEQPFHATLMMNMPFVEDANMPMKTLATDGKTVWYDPSWVVDNDEPIVRFGICHEVMHGVFRHMFRRGSRDPRLWNMAGDYVINGLLKEEGMRIWEHALLDDDLVTRGGGTTEGVYELLREKQEAGGGGGMGEPFDDLRDPGGSPAEVEHAEAEMQVRVAQAAAAAKMCGKLSAGMEKFIQSALAPKIAWEDRLRQFFNRSAKQYCSFARPKRRHLAAGLYLPALTGEAMGAIVLAVDQSGSVGDHHQEQFFAEAIAQHQECLPSELHIMYFDTEVSRVDTFMPDDEVTFGRYRTGGTAFSPIFRKIEELDIMPACVVVLTDLECSDFGPEPDYPVMWVSVRPGRAPFGEIVELKDEM